MTRSSRTLRSTRAVKEVDPSAPVVEMDSVSLVFPGQGRKRKLSRALDNVSMRVNRHEIVAILGPSGCGKSTLLNLIAGFLSPTAGTVRTEGVTVSGPNQAVGYVTQRDTLLPWRTIERNIEVPLEIRGVPRGARGERVASELQRVNLQNFASYYPHQLSGGMRQRANLIRTLVYEPDILLMDEPFGALDALLRLRLQQEVLDLWSRQPNTIIYVTHDIDEAIALASRVMVMTSSPAAVKAWFDIPYEYPRDVVKIRAADQTSKLRDLIWESLAAEIDQQAET
jgi:NitT/TauT family transport system ATP-binding protein